MLLDTAINNPLLFVMLILGLIAGITIHEFSHAYAADHLGDPTPRLNGRISLNPRAHLDPLGSLFILIAGFGWGKPVMIDHYNFKNPSRDSAYVSLAGPASNFFLALMCSIFLYIFHISGFSPGNMVESVLAILIYVNAILGVFNLLPIYPLDGFSIVQGFLPPQQAAEWMTLKSYGFIFLLAMIVPLFGGSSMVGMIISPIIRTITTILIPSGGILM